MPYGNLTAGSAESDEENADMDNNKPEYPQRGAAKGRCPRRRGEQGKRWTRSCGAPAAIPVDPESKSWSDNDEISGDQLPFRAERPAGLHWPDSVEPNQEVQFFNLFLSPAMIQKIVDNANEHAWLRIRHFSSYAA